MQAPYSVDMDWRECMDAFLAELRVCAPYSGVDMYLDFDRRWSTRITELLTEEYICSKRPYQIIMMLDLCWMRCQKARICHKPDYR